MTIQNIINLYGCQPRMCSLEKFRGDVNSRDLLHNLNIPSYTLLLRMSDNLGTTFLVMGISVKLLIKFQFSTSATSTVIGLILTDYLLKSSESYFITYKTEN